MTCFFLFSQYTPSRAAGSRGRDQLIIICMNFICINTAMTFSQGPKPEKKWRPGRLLTILGGTGPTPHGPRSS